MLKVFRTWGFSEERTDALVDRVEEDLEEISNAAIIIEKKRKRLRCTHLDLHALMDASRIFLLRRTFCASTTMPTEEFRTTKINWEALPKVLK